LCCAGKNCTNAVASASLTLTNGTAYTITAGNTVFTNYAAWSTGRLNLTLTNPINYDNVTNATLCMTLQSPCANIFALCQQGNGTSCGTFVSVFAYRQKKSCCESCIPAGRALDCIDIAAALSHFGLATEPVVSFQGFHGAAVSLPP
jgi:hypothetical protein